MGRVYIAEHLQLNRTVAIKSLLPQFLGNKEIKARFKNEASTLAHLQHPNIVGLFDYIETDSGMYLIMEYVKGTPLDDLISKIIGPLPEPKALPIMKGILDGFSYAHKQGVIHRDIKPANIIITENDEVKILDFGIARLIGEGNQNLTKTGTQMGTVFYMSPEQVQGKKVDIRTDIYSLGVTFYQMLTGINPYKDLTTEYEIYTKIVKEDLTPPQEIYPGIPMYFAAVIKKAMEKDPKNRFQTCEEFLAAIQDKSVNTADAPDYKEDDGQDTVQTSPVIIEDKVNKNQKKKMIAIMGFIPIFLAGGIISYYSFYNKDQDHDGVADRYDACPDVSGGSGLGCPPDSDGDGVYDTDDACPDMFAENGLGCPPDSDGDGVYDKDDACPDLAGKGVDGCQLNGSHMFWYDADDSNNYWSGDIQIYVDGNYEGTINAWADKNPGCGTSGFVTISRPPGTYKVTTVNEKWDFGSATFTIYEDQCNDTPYVNKQ